MSERDDAALSVRISINSILGHVLLYYAISRL